MGKYIGFYGCPPKNIMQIYRQKYNLDFIDLDEDLGSPDSKLLPHAYCRIIKNIIDNSIALHNQLKVVIAAVGEDKCDQGRFAAYLLKDMGFDVVEVRNNDLTNSSHPLKICSSNLPLDEKVKRIMKTVFLEDNNEYEQCNPTHGYWGVPPYDLNLLKIFPNTTHVFGWTRCVEAQRPADLELECYVDSDIPIAFFTQTFCGKQQLAKYLAEKYRGLFIDCDGPATQSVLAKIEAFIRLG